MRTLTAEARESRAAYKRAWAKKNKDKVNEYQRRYWEKKAAEAGEHEKVENAEKS